MADYRHRMNKKHPGTGKAHDFSNTLPHLGLIAVYLAVGAKGLCLHKRTLITAHSGVIFQLCTFRAESSVFPSPDAFRKDLCCFLQYRRIISETIFFSLSRLSCICLLLSVFINFIFSLFLLFFFLILLQAKMNIHQLIQSFCSIIQSAEPVSAHPPVFHGISTICNPHGGFPVGH